MKHGLFKRFFSNQSGSVLLLMGLSSLFLIGIGGAGYDLGRQQLVRQKIQQASDAAALAGAGVKCTADPCTDRINTALRYYKINVPPTYLGVTRPEPTITAPYGGPVTVDASAPMRNSFVNNLGITELHSKGHTKVDTGGGGAANFDVLMLLDVSGSMNDGTDGTRYGWPNKIMALKTAATILIHSLLDPNADANVCDPVTLKGCNRVGFLPYNLGAPPFSVTQDSRCNCIHYYQYYCCGNCGGNPGGGGEGDASDILGKKFFARMRSNIVSDAQADVCTPTGCGGGWTSGSAIATCSTYAGHGAPPCTTFNPQGANCNEPTGCIPTKPSPDSHGEIWGCFPDGLGNNMNYCELLVRDRYHSDCEWHNNYGYDYPAGYDYNPTNVILRMNPLNAYGKTNSGDAFRVAMDPNGVPAEATGTGTPLILLPAARPQNQGVAKVIIWLTDGDNTAWTDASRTTSDCGTYNWQQSCNGRINYGTDSQADLQWGAKSDADTLAACAALKAQNPPTIIYTIGFGNEVQQPYTRGYRLLSQCASGGLNSYFFLAPDAATLQQVFTTILENLNKLRITE